MAPKQQSRLAALRKKLQTAVARWVRSKEVVTKCRFKLRCAEQGKKNLKRVVDDKRKKLLLEYPEEDIAELLDGEESDDSDSSPDRSS
jgi:hypothetical protein